LRVLTGIQPSGDLHIGNYFGSIKAMIESQNDHEVFAFIANYHAMSSLSDGERLSKLTMQAATDFLALGNGPAKVYLLGAVGCERGSRTLLDTFRFHSDGVARAGAQLQR